MAFPFFPSMESWKEHLTFFESDTWRNLRTFLKKECKQGKTILPAKDDIFNALLYTPFDQVKVVILGQDPYPNERHAHGLAFSIPKTTADIPKSLKNILKELENDLGIKTNSGNLEPWTQEGVLLLNTILTVEEGNSNAHKGKGWEKLTTEIIQTINKKLEHIVFILWGNQAQKKKKHISDGRHLILSSPHPSPLSAYRGFWRSSPFSRTNKYLQDHGKTPINWEL